MCGLGFYLMNRRLFFSMIDGAHGVTGHLIGTGLFFLVFFVASDYLGIHLGLARPNLPKPKDRSVLAEQGAHQQCWDTLGNFTPI